MKKQRMREIIADSERVRAELAELHDMWPNALMSTRLEEVLASWPRPTSDATFSPASSMPSGVVFITVNGIPLYPGYRGQHSFIATPDVAFTVPGLDGVTITVHQR